MISLKQQSYQINLKHVTKKVYQVFLEVINQIQTIIKFKKIPLDGLNKQKTFFK
jgi:hypothetical protein